MVFERPKRPNGGRPSPATQRPNSPTQRPTQRSGNRPSSGSGGNGGRNGRGGGNGRGNNNNSGGQPFPSPWLIEPPVAPDESASFIEYLRWMRAYDSDDPYRDSKKVEILQIAEKQANYHTRLTQMTERTEKIAKFQAGETFQVSCPWRIRVGGHCGPENILLPAFDATGMPYIPSSTLRGVARAQAIRETMEKENLLYKDAEEKISREYFGYLDSNKSSERIGKVTFLDAYPLAKRSDSGGIAVDIANNIWSWSEGNTVDYHPNPNAFLSLKQPTFLVGLSPRNQQVDRKTISQVKRWLTGGLVAGVGAQINTGYGVLCSSAHCAKPFLQVPFTLEGQLIHGVQRIHKSSARGIPDCEVRPTAFKSMLRYWFRALASGVLNVGTSKEIEKYHKASKTQKSLNPPATVKALEALLFGSITPQTWGWLTFRVEGETLEPIQESKNNLRRQAGRMMLFFSPHIPKQHRVVVQNMFKALIWLMFHLGGVGQGARRPCYSRSSKPFYRGASLSLGINPDVDFYGDLYKRYGLPITPGGNHKFWEIPETFSEFQTVFKDRLSLFFSTLSQLTGQTTDHRYQHLKKVIGIQGSSHEWAEAIDKDCCIFLIDNYTNYEVHEKDTRIDKPSALKLLHEKFHQFEDSKDIYNAKNLAGHTKDDYVPPPLSNKPSKRKKRGAIASPVWISNINGQYQVVTVFGASNKPRSSFVKDITCKRFQAPVVQVWPII